MTPQKSNERLQMNTTRSCLRLSTGFLVGTGVLLAGALPAYAVPTVAMNTGVLLVKESLDGRVGRETGAGVMMAAVAPMTGNKLIATWMDSDVDVIDAGWQGKVAVIQMNATSAPSLIVPPTQITTYNGERPFNHPDVAVSMAGTHAVIAFASTKEDGSNTREYAMVVDATGHIVVDSLKFGTDDGNTGGTSIYYAGQDAMGHDRFIAGYQHNNNDSWVAGLVLDTSTATPTLTQTYNTEFYNPTNIGRPKLAIVDANTATACTEVGDNRPPEYGIGCAVINTNDGTILAGGGGSDQNLDVHNGIVAASHPDQDPKIYMNQASVAYLGSGQCALGVVQSDGAGRNNNRGGTNVSLLYQIDCKTLKVLGQTSPTMGVAPFQRHAELITSIYSNAGLTYVGHVGCSSTGAGSAGAQMVAVDPVKGIAALDSTTRQNQLLPVSWGCDSAWLANKGLRNPNDQGRDFIRAIGNVKNPGYQIQGGWMPEASNFMVVTVPMVRMHDKSTLSGDAGSPQYAGNGPDGGPGKEYQRNSLHLSFVPVAWDPKVQVVMSGAVDSANVSPGFSQCISGCGDTTNPTNPYSPSNPHNSQYGPHKTYGSFGDSGCGCVVAPGAGDAGSGLGAFALVGLGLALAVSRRRRS
jgi:MYXO-CTERM domain-containing protein